MRAVRVGIFGVFVRLRLQLGAWEPDLRRQRAKQILHVHVAAERHQHCVAGGALVWVDLIMDNASAKMLSALFV